MFAILDQITEDMPKTYTVHSIVGGYSSQAATDYGTRRHATTPLHQHLAPKYEL